MATVALSHTSSRSAAPAARLTTGRKALWAGRILSGIGAAFLLMDATFKFILSPEAVEGTAKLGWQTDVIPTLGALQFILLALYVYPRTAVLGALLWTGYLGGAIATHVRVDNPLFSHVLFPTYVAAFLWLGLWLRDARLRALLPFTSAVGKDASAPAPDATR